MSMNFARSKRGKELEAFFNELGRDAFAKDHWDLAKISGISANEWREFLTSPEVVKYIRDEMESISEAETRKMIMDISTRAKSTGTAQTLLALDKSRGGSSKKSGPIFIFCAVPLNDREKNAPNVEILETDPFKIPGG